MLTVNQLNASNFIVFVCRKWFKSMESVFDCFQPFVAQMEENLALLNRRIAEKERAKKESN